MHEAPTQPLDPELEALPTPRRPFRRLTIAVLAVTAVASASLAWALRDAARFAALSGEPRELGSLTGVQLGSEIENRWVHAVGGLEDRAAEYRRPLDPDRYRLAPAAGNERLWVELRIPAGIEPERYVAPNSFVGRLVPLSRMGPRSSGLALAASTVRGRPMPGDAWVLVDGESPATMRWALGIVALLGAFALWCAWGLVRLLAPVRDEN